MGATFGDVLPPLPSRNFYASLAWLLIPFPELPKLMDGEEENDKKLTDKVDLHQKRPIATFRKGKTK